MFVYLGFVLLVIGMGIYNGVWEHLIRRFLTRRPISSERSQLLPSHDDTRIYDSTSNVPSGAGVYIESTTDATTA